jgi:hypothetical protein
MKTSKLLSLTVCFVAVLSACSPSLTSELPTQITGLNLPGNIAALTSQAIPTQTPITTATPVMQLTSTPANTPMATLAPANTPVWTDYHFTCALATGGGTMTMNLAWSDRSDNETGYIVYRDKQAIMTLPANSTTYVDIAFVATGKSLSYFVEALNNTGPASTSTITYGCQ